LRGTQKRTPAKASDGRRPPLQLVILSKAKDLANCEWFTWFECTPSHRKVPCFARDDEQGILPNVQQRE